MNSAIDANYFDQEDQEDQVGEEIAAEAAFTLLRSRILQWATEAEYEGFLVISGDVAKNYFIQFATYENGRICCEASSNEVVPARFALNATQKTQMAALGWIENPEHTNYEQVVSDKDVAACADQCIVLAKATLHDVFGVSQLGKYSVFDSNNCVSESEPKTELRQRKAPYAEAPVKTSHGWCITPKAKVSITLTCADKDVSEEVLEVFRHGRYGHEVRYRKLIAVFMTNGITCHEVDEVLNGMAGAYKDIRSHVIAGDVSAGNEIANERLYQHYLNDAITESLGLDAMFGVLFESPARPEWLRPDSISPEIPLDVVRYYLRHYNKKYGSLFDEKDGVFNSLLDECIKYGLVRVGADVGLDLICEKIKVQDINSALGTSHSRRRAAVDDLRSRSNPLQQLSAVVDLRSIKTPSTLIADSDAEKFWVAWMWSEKLVTIIFEVLRGARPAWSRRNAICPQLDIDKLKMRAISLHRRHMPEWRRGDPNRNVRIDPDPIRGGRPREVLTPVRPDEAARFSYWNYRLGSLLSSQRMDEPEYLEVTTLVAEKVLSLIPLAHDQVKELAAKYPHHTGRFETTENTALPKYVRYLAAAGRLEEAIAVCDLCIGHRIDDGVSDGFEQRKERLTKKLSAVLGASKPKKLRGKVSEEQIAMILSRYDESTPAQRQAMAAEMELTMSHLYYIVSTKKRLK